MDIKQGAVMKLLEEALALAPNQRTAFLEDVCRKQPGLHEQARALLDAHSQAQSFLDKPLLECLTSWLIDPQEQLSERPERIGPYKILEVLGEGGMGTVYLASQETPVKRNLAIKVIKHGLDSREVLARFRAEHQALACMNHENIAAVYDSGTHEGNPYFAMEYLAGIPITQFCMQHHLSLEERLSLFLQACEGVAHAHQRCILHRDLKPSNVLVAFQEKRIVLKIIDFGIAKALNHIPLTDLSLHTEQGRLLGTPAYMSPEQLDSSGLDVDARSDVFALGHLLYELLTDLHVHDHEQLRKLPLVQRLQHLAEAEPLPPSKRIESLGVAAPSKSFRLKGELDWITTRALAHERQRRYGSVAELSGDIRKYLCGFPVSAGPPSLSYKLSKFALRHRGPLAAAGLIFGVLLLCLLLLEQNKREARRSAQRAESAELRFSAIDEVLSEVLLLTNPHDVQFMGRTRTFLDKLVVDIGADLANHPLVLIDVTIRLMHAHISLGDLERAQYYLDLSLNSSRAHLGENHCQILELQRLEAYILFRKGAYVEAERSYREVEFQIEQIPNCSAVLLWRTRRGLANTLRLDGRPEQAQPIYEALLAEQIEGDEEALLTLRAMGNNQRALNQLDKAEKSFRRAWQGQRDRLGANHPEALSSWENIALVLSDRGNYAQAEPYFRHCAKVRKEVLGSIHRETLGSLNLLGYTLYQLNRIEEAEMILRKVYMFQRELLGVDAVETMSAQNNLGLALVGKKNLTEAVSLFRDLLRKQRDKLGHDHKETLSTAGNLSHIYKELGQFQDAEMLILETLAVRESRLSGHHRSVLISKTTLAEVLMNQGKYELALGYLLEVVCDAPRTYPEGHVLRAVFSGYLGRNYRELGQYKKAETHLLKSYSHLRKGQSSYRAEILEDLIALYSVWQTKKQAKWLVERESLSQRR